MAIKITAQIIGIFGMAANIWSYQQKTKLSVLVFQLAGAVLFTLNFVLLGAITGAMLNGINILLALVFVFKDRTHADHVAWAVAFSFAYISAYAMTFLVFDMPPTLPNLAREALPLAGTLLTVASYKMKDAAAIRRLGFFRSPVWLIYDAFVFSVGGVLCEVFSLASMIVGVIRLDRKKKA